MYRLIIIQKFHKKRSSRLKHCGTKNFVPVSIWWYRRDLNLLLPDERTQFAGSKLIVELGNGRTITP